MRYLSVCSGIEAATVAWHPLGWSPVAFAEIEKFPSAVLAHHYPHVPNLGDMTKYKDWPDADVDVLVGGTPCQSFSVAGLRKGMADPRGNLALTYLAIADRYRPEWMLWENVPGVLSSSGGRDFGAFIGGLAELGYGFAYRVLDAQYVRVDGFGRAVPQRRRRVFVVGNSRDWRRAAAVLFEHESLSWDSAPRREAGQGFAVDVAPSIVSSGRGTERIGETRGQDCVIASTGNVAHCLNAGAMGRIDYETETMIAFSCKDHGADASSIAPTLRSMGHDGSHANAGGQLAVAFQSNAGSQGGDVYEELCPTLRVQKAGGGGMPAIATSWAVRRLTPRECERLQAFPDCYTDIPWRGKDHAPDGPRYKALGNSMAVNVMRWIGRRIQMVQEIGAPPMTPKEDQQPMTTREELVARELLAKEYDVGGHDGAYPTYAALARDPNNKGAFTMCSIRAVAAALRLASRQEVSVEELAMSMHSTCASVIVPQGEEIVARALLAEYSITKRTTEG